MGQTGDHFRRSLKIGDQVLELETNITMSFPSHRKNMCRNLKFLIAEKNRFKKKKTPFFATARGLLMPG
jgi:hypothetical protein